MGLKCLTSNLKLVKGQEKKCTKVINDKDSGRLLKNFGDSM